MLVGPKESLSGLIAGRVILGREMKPSKYPLDPLSTSRWFQGIMLPWALYHQQQHILSSFAAVWAKDQVEADSLSKNPS